MSVQPAPNLLLLQGALTNSVDSLMSPNRLEAKVSSAGQMAFGILGKCYVSTVALLSKFPYIRPNLELPFPPAVQDICASTNFISWLIFECDNGFKIINTINETPSEDKKALASPEKLSCLAKTALGASCFALATISRLPAAFQAITFNEKKYAPAIAAVVLGAEGIFPMRSLMLAAQRTIDSWTAGQETNVNQEKRDALKSRIAANQSYFEEKMTPQEKADFIGEIEKIVKDTSEVGQKRVAYLNKLLSKVITPPEQTSSLLDKAATITGLFFAANYIVFNAMYAFTGTKEFIVDNDVARGIVCGLVVLTSTYLTGKVLTDITKQAIRSVADLFNPESTKTLAQQFYGKTVLTLQGATLFTSLFSVGAYFQIVSQYYQSTPNLQTYFRITVSIPMFLLLQASANNFIKSQVEYWGFTKGPKDKQDIINMVSVFNNLKNLIDDMDANNIDLFDAILNQKTDIEMGPVQAISEEEVSAGEGEKTNTINNDSPDIGIEGGNKEGSNSEDPNQVGSFTG